MTSILATHVQAGQTSLPPGRYSGISPGCQSELTLQVTMITKCQTTNKYPLEFFLSRTHRLHRELRSPKESAETHLARLTPFLREDSRFVAGGPGCYSASTVAACKDRLETTGGAASLRQILPFLFIGWPCSWGALVETDIK